MGKAWRWRHLVFEFYEMFFKNFLLILFILIMSRLSTISLTCPTKVESKCATFLILEIGFSTDFLKGEISRVPRKLIFLEKLEMGKV
jgi:hypothetical protein